MNPPRGPAVRCWKCGSARNLRWVRVLDILGKVCVDEQACVETQRSAGGPVLAGDVDKRLEES